MSTPPPGGPSPVWPPQPGSPSPYSTPPQSSNATLILVLGILSIFFFGIVLGPIAWIQGNAALAMLNAGVGDESQRGNITTGRICGIIGTVLSMLGIIGYIVFFVVLGVYGAHHPSSVPLSPSSPQ